MAVYRSAMFEEKGLRTQFLVFGKPLTRYLGQAIEQTRIAGSTDNFNSWFGTWYFKHFRRYVPVRPGPQRSIDWERVTDRLAEKAPGPRTTRDQGYRAPGGGGVPPVGVPPCAVAVRC